MNDIIFGTVVQFIIAALGVLFGWLIKYKKYAWIIAGFNPKNLIKIKRVMLWEVILSC